MKLDSVLGLKAELKEDPVLPRAVARALAVSVRSASVAARADRVHTRSPDATTYALGVAPGKRRGDYRLGVRIQVRGAPARRAAEEIAARAHGEADIRIVPKVRARAKYPPSWFRKLRRPLEAGLSIGHHEITAGTLASIVEDDDAYYLLSNNHVLANVNEAAPGDPVVQPGPLDRKVSSRTLVGVLDRFVPISFQRSNLVDCAIAEMMEDLEFYSGWNQALAGYVAGVEPLTVDDLERPVLKVGRTTGITRGTITQVDIDRLTVDLGEEGAPKDALFSDQFEISTGTLRPFSDGGDSGSLIVDERRRARGLLFCGGPDENGIDLTYANRIETALKKLGVKLTT